MVFTALNVLATPCVLNTLPGVLDTPRDVIDTRVDVVLPILGVLDTPAIVSEFRLKMMETQASVLKGRSTEIWCPFSLDPPGQTWFEVWGLGFGVWG